MSKKDFKRGVEAAIKTNTAFMHKQAAATKELGKRIVQKIDDQGKIIDVILDTLNDQEKKELYELQSEYDIADLGQNEKEVLASYLLTLIAKYDQNTKEQKDYYFAVKKHLEVTDVSDDLNLAVVENVDSRAELKAMFKTVCEFLFLKTGDGSFLDIFENEIEHFGLTSKLIREIVASIERIYNMLGLRGIVEHYIPAEDEAESVQTKETSKYVVLDWETDQEYCLQNGVELDYWKKPKLVSTRNCIVRNFPRINIDSSSVIDCIFENCDDITIEESFVTNCEFKNIGYYFINNTKFSKSVFDTACYCNEDDALFSLEDVEIDNSTFKNIKLTNNTYLFSACGYCKIRNSKFVDIFTDRADMELYEYECSDGKGIFKTTYQGTLIEKDSCEGLDMVNVITGISQELQFTTSLKNEKTESPVIPYFQKPIVIIYSSRSKHGAERAKMLQIRIHERLEKLNMECSVETYSGDEAKKKKNIFERENFNIIYIGEPSLSQPLYKTIDEWDFDTLGMKYITRGKESIIAVKELKKNQYKDFLEFAKKQALHQENDIKKNLASQEDTILGTAFDKDESLALNIMVGVLGYWLLLPSAMIDLSSQRDNKAKLKNIQYSVAIDKFVSSKIDPYVNNII